MCEVSEKIIVSCQLSFITLGDIDYHEDIQKVITIIEKSNLNYTIGQMSTIIKGDSLKVMNLINTICYAMKDKEYLINMSLSNICGCEKTKSGTKHG
ncbi:hypothetical protein FACS1894137_15540 [Spirochaetia bacterium]|nr:hypothetical protein FACS1894137_15540 [Spirochaetia bacterium]